MKNKQRSRSDAGAGSGTGARGTGNDQESGTQKVRLQRVMADAGVAARRDCETMIEEGRVTVNGEVVRKLPVFVDPEVDDIRVEGRGLRKPERKLYLMVNKPERMLVTNADEPEFDRATIMEIVDHPAKARLFPVGRLDFESAGLVLMTNDGELANMISHPRYQVPKVYEALVRGVADQTSISAIGSKLRAMRKRNAREEGVEGPVAAGPGPEIEIVKYHGGNTLLRITLLEAKNRELRDLLSYLGMPIKKLTRIGIGGLELRGLPLATWRELAREEVHMLRKTRAGYVKRYENLPPPMPPTESMLQAEREKQARRGGRSGGVMLNDIDRERMEEKMESEGTPQREPSADKPDRKVTSSGSGSGSGGTYVGGRFGDLMDEVPVKPVRGRVLNMDRSGDEPQNPDQANSNKDGGGFSGARGRKGGYGGFERRDGGGPRRGRPDPNPNRNAEAPRGFRNEGFGSEQSRGFSGGPREEAPGNGPGRGPKTGYGEKSEEFGGGYTSGTRTRPTFGNRKGPGNDRGGPPSRDGASEGRRTDRTDRGERGSVRGRSSGGFGSSASEGGSRGGFGPSRTNRGSSGGFERGASRGSRDGGSSEGPRGGKPTGGGGSKFSGRPTGGKPGTKAGGKPSGKGGFKGGGKTGGGRTGGKGRGS